MFLSLNRSSLLRNQVARSTFGKVSCARPFASATKKSTSEGEAVKPVDVPLTPPSYQSSTLSNGVRVVTVSSKQPVSSVGLFINAGSRNETQSNAGASFFLRHLAFKANEQHSSVRFVRSLELLGANYTVTTGREHTSFIAEVPTDQVPELVPVLSGVLQPSLQEYEIKDEAENVERSVHEIETNPRALTLELLHQEAYRNKGLGQSLYTPAFNIHHLDTTNLSSYVKSNYTNDNLVVVATGGVEHDSFAKLVGDYFAKGAKGVSKTTPSQYVGGESRHPGDFETHLALGFEGVSTSSKDFAALGVLQQLLGSGRSYTTFSIGSGNAARLNRNVVAPNGSWIEEASAFNFNYSDSGIFGVFAIAKRGNVSKLVDNITKELNKVSTATIAADELARAKAQFKASILFNTESRLPFVEFVGKQTLTNKLASPSEVAKSVDAVSANDVVNVAKKVFKSRPTLVVLGDVTNAPTLDQISSALSK